jgi:DnaJ-class molecular chaperone
VPTAFQDYYATLGVPKTATEKEIKTAFRKLARKYHPDVNRDDPAAERKFKEANEANEVLSDPEKRRRYDELGPQWREYEAWEKAGRPGGTFGGGGARGGSPFGGGGSPFSQGGVEYRTATPEEMESLFGDDDPFSDFFHSMFGRGAGGASAGTGTRARSRPRARRAAAPQRGGDVEGEAEITLEEAYSGTTRTVELSGGTRPRRVEIKIPGGVADGARVRARGQGGEGSDGATAGDLFVRVRVLPHPRFTREGDDLRVTVAAPVDTALLGGEVPVQTIRGTTAQLTLKPVTQDGSRMRLRGLGMPRLRGGGTGDLIAEIHVRLPDELTPAARSLAEQLHEERTHSS